MPSIHPNARCARPAGLFAAVIITLVVPGSVLASTPLGTVGGTEAPPETNPMAQLLDLLPVLAVLVGVVVLVVGLAWLVARIGGPAVAAASSPGSVEPKRPGPVIATVLPILVASGALVVGVLGGRSFANERSMGGLGGAIGEGILIAVLAVVLIALVAIGLIALGLRHGHMSRAIGTTLAAAGLVAIGTLGGNATAAATGGVYVEPIVLTSSGQARLDLQAGSAPFAAQEAGRTDCESVPDGQSVARVTALDLGELGTGTLRAMLYLSTDPSNATPVEFFIDGADLPDGSAQLSWAGSGQAGELGSGGTSGKLTFSNLTLSDPAAKPDPGASAASPTVPGWPVAISGSLTWTCQPWGAPPAHGVAPPPSVAP